MRNKTGLIMDEGNLVNLLKEYIKEMKIMGYGEWYIGKTLAYIFQSLEDDNNVK